MRTYLWWSVKQTCRKGTVANYKLAGKARDTKYWASSFENEIGFVIVD